MSCSGCFRVAEYLSVLDDAAFGGATPVEPKTISPTDPLSPVGVEPHPAGSALPAASSPTLYRSRGVAKIEDLDPTSSRAPALSRRTREAGISGRPRGRRSWAKRTMPRTPSQCPVSKPLRSTPAAGPCNAPRPAAQIAIQVPGKSPECLFLLIEAVSDPVAAFGQLSRRLRLFRQLSHRSEACGIVGGETDVLARAVC